MGARSNGHSIQWATSGSVDDVSDQGEGGRLCLRPGVPGQGAGGGRRGDPVAEVELSSGSTEAEILFMMGRLDGCRIRVNRTTGEVCVVVDEERLERIWDLDEGA